MFDAGTGQIYFGGLNLTLIELKALLNVSLSVMRSGIGFNLSGFNFPPLGAFNVLGIPRCSAAG